jgi:hypothetical protein
MALLDEKINLPENHDHKSIEGFSTVPEKSKKKITTIGELTDRSKKEFEEIDDTQHTYKNLNRVEEVVDQSQKQIEPIAVDIESVVKENKTIKEIDNRDKKEFNSIDENNQHSKKEDITVVSTERNNNKIEQRISINSDRFIKNETIRIDDVKKPKEEKEPAVKFNHSKKIETEINPTSFEIKTESEIKTDEDRETKYEEPIKDEDHESKIEIGPKLNPYHDSKIEEDIFNAGFRDFKEEIELSDADHESKEETEIDPSSDESKEEVELQQSNIESNKELTGPQAPVYSNAIIESNLNYESIDLIQNPRKEFGLNEAPRYNNDQGDTNVSYTGLDLINTDTKLEEEISNDSDRDRKFPYIDIDIPFDDSGIVYESTEPTIDITTSSIPNIQENFKTYTYEEVLQRIFNNIINKTENEINEKVYDSNTINFENNFVRKNKKVARTDRASSTDTHPEYAVSRDTENPEDSDVLYNKNYERKRYIMQMLTRYDLISLFTNDPMRSIILRGLREAESFGLNGNFVGEQASKIVNQALDQLAKATDIGFFSGDPSADGMHAFDVSRKLGIQALRMGYSRAQSALLMGGRVDENDINPAAGKIAKSLNAVNKITEKTGSMLNPGGALKKLGNTTENITEGFIPHVMKDNKINKSAGHIFSSMYNYITTLQQHAVKIGDSIGGLLSNLDSDGQGLSPRDLKKLRRKQKKLEKQREGLSETDKKLNEFLTPLLPPSEFASEKDKDNNRKEDTYYSVDKNRNEAISSSNNKTWRRYNFTQKPENPDDFKEDYLFPERNRKDHFRASDDKYGHGEDQQSIEAGSSDFKFRSFLFAERFTDGPINPGNADNSFNAMLVSDYKDADIVRNIITPEIMNTVYDSIRDKEVINKEYIKFDEDDELPFDSHLLNIHDTHVSYPKIKDVFFDTINEKYPDKVFKIIDEDSEIKSPIVEDMKNEGQLITVGNNWYIYDNRNEDDKFSLYNRIEKTSQKLTEDSENQKDPHLKETESFIKPEGPKERLFRYYSNDDKHYSIDTIINKNTSKRYSENVDPKGRTLVNIDRERFAVAEEDEAKILSNFVNVESIDREKEIYKNTYDNQISIKYKDEWGEEHITTHPYIKDHILDERSDKKDAKNYSFGGTKTTNKKSKNIFGVSRDDISKSTPTDEDERAASDVINIYQLKDINSNITNNNAFNESSRASIIDPDTGEEISKTLWDFRDTHYQTLLDNDDKNTMAFSIMKNHEDDTSVMKQFSPDAGPRDNMAAPYSTNVMNTPPLFEDTININEVNPDQTPGSLSNAKNGESHLNPSIDLSGSTSDRLAALKGRQHGFASENVKGKGKQPVRINRMWNETKYDVEKKRYELADNSGEAVIIYETGSDGKSQISHEERLFPSNPSKRYKDVSNITKEKYIYRLNNKDYGSHRAKDNHDLGYVAVLAGTGKDITATRDGALYTIPFQFNPEIVGETRQANWSSQTAMGRTNEFFFWNNTSARGLQLKTTVAITSEDPNSSDNNLAFPWAAEWTEEYVLEVINLYRSLVLPISFTDSSLPTTPPIISIVRGPMELRWTNLSGTRLARWIVDNISIDAKEEVGFTLNQTPRAFDINISLKEVYDSWKDWQDGENTRQENYSTIEEGHY